VPADQVNRRTSCIVYRIHLYIRFSQCNSNVVSLAIRDPNALSFIYTFLRIYK
jgi:hypothetical protein